MSSLRFAGQSAFRINQQNEDIDKEVQSAIKGRNVLANTTTEEETPLAFQDISEDKFKDVNFLNNKAKTLQDEASQLPEEFQRKLKSTLSEKDFKTLKLNEKLKIIQDNVLFYKFQTNVSPEVRNEIASYAKENALSADDVKKLTIQSLTYSPEKFAQILKFAKENKQYISEDTIGPIIAAGKEFQDKTPENDKKFADKIKEMKENIELLKKSDKLKAFAKMNPKIGEVLETDPEKIQSLKDDNFSLGGLIINSSQRFGQLGQSILLGFKSLVTKDPQEAEAYSELMKNVAEDAYKGTWWNPPRVSFDGHSTMKFIMGRAPAANTDVIDTSISLTTENLFKDISTNINPKMYWRAALFPPSGVLDAKEMYDQARSAHHQLNKLVTKEFFDAFVGTPLKLKLHQQYMKENSIDMVSYSKNVLYNNMVGVMGFLNDIAIDPVNLIGTVVKIGSTGTKIQSLAKKTMVVQGIDAEKLIKSSKAFENHLLKEANSILKIDAKDFAEANKFTGEVESIVKMAEPSKRNAATVKKILKFRDLNEQVNFVKEFRDEIIAYDTKLKANMAPVEKKIAERQVLKLREMAKDYSQFTKSKSFTKPMTMDIIVKDGTARLSKKGMKMMKDLRSSVRFYDEFQQMEDEFQVAKQALTDPKIFDKGVKIFGLEVPGTRYLEDQTRMIMSKVPIVNRFPSTNKQTISSFNKYLREREANVQITHDLVVDLHKGMSDKDKIRLSFAIETGRLNDLPNTFKVNENGTLQDIAKLYKEQTDNIALREMEADYKFLDELKARGFSEDIAKGYMKKNGAFFFQDYIEDYQSIILRNRKALDQLKLRLKREDLGYLDAKDLKKSNRAFQRNMDSSAIFNFNKKRAVPTRSEYYKMFLKEEDHVKVDRLIDNIVNDIDFDKSVKELKALGKNGVDPVMKADELLFARMHAGSNAIMKRRLNLNLAADSGVNTFLTDFFKEETTVIEGLAKEFKGIALPDDVTRALNILDRPSLTSRLKKELDTGYKFSKETNRVSPTIALATHQKVMNRVGLSFLQTTDAVNNFFKSSVTHVFPKFHFRNAASNVFMNYADIGVKAFDPIQNVKIERLLLNKDVKGFGKDMLFTNSYGHVMSGEEMLKAMQENGVFISFNKVSEKTGAETITGLMRSNPLSKFGQNIEDHARAMNFVANWQKGHSFAESAARSRKMLVDYSNVSAANKEVLNRLLLFHTFFQQNAINTIETLIKNPARILVPARVVPHSLGYDVKMPPSGVKNFYGETPAFKKEPDGTVRQMTSDFLTYNDLDRYTSIVRNSWKAYEAWSMNQKELSEMFGKNALRDAVFSLAPTYQFPLAVFDSMTGLGIFKNKKVTPEIAEYITKTPVWMKQMVGLDFKPNNKTGNIDVYVSPVANIMFSMAGGSRFLSTASQALDPENSTLDFVTNFISPITTRKHNVDDLKKINDMYKRKDLERISDDFEKDIEDRVRQIKLEEKFLEMQRKKREEKGKK